MYKLDKKHARTNLKRFLEIKQINNQWQFQQLQSNVNDQFINKAYISQRNLQKDKQHWKRRVRKGHTLHNKNPLYLQEVEGVRRKMKCLHF